MDTTMQKLVEDYMPLANKLAYQKKRTLPSFIDIEELKSAAYFGLVEAASRFDPERGIAFSTFAYRRVFGAILDYLRELGWAKNSKMMSLDANSDEEGQTWASQLEAKEERDSPNDFFEVVGRNFDDQGNAILRHYYIDDCSMKEIGNKFDVSESRISQLIKNYKERIHDECDEFELREMAA